MKKKKYICINFNKIFLAVVLFFVLVSTIFSINISASDNVNTESTLEEKKYFNGTIDDEFSNDKIIIVLSKEETNKYKEYTASDFPEIDCKSVSDLTSSVVEMVKNNKTGGENKSLINFDKFNRILSLELEEKSKENVIKSIKKLEKRVEILSAEPSVSTQLCNTLSDSGISEQWGLNSVKAPDAWNICQNASQIIVGVLDTGIDSKHNDLTNRIYKSKPINDQLHRDFTSDLELGEPVLRPKDPNGHGTHVAGIIGAAGNNDVGFRGICWDVKLVSLRVANEIGKLEPQWLIRAISYAASVNIPILNCSLGINEDSPGLKKAIELYAGLLVCCAGNDGKDIDKKREYPASYDCDNIITVGAIDSNDNRSKWNDSSNLWGLAGEKSSNYGQTSVDIYAPGTDIYSTIPNNDYEKKGGTSMAAPFVTGAAALLLAANSNLSAAQIKNAIINGADPISITVPASNCSGKENQSVLKLNIYNAIRRVAFKVDSSGEKIVGTWFNINGNIVIPDIINGTTITTIGAEAFKGCSNLSSITIPSAVTSIESSAFEDCCSLVSVNLSKDLKSIGSSAFKGCSDLSSITIPNRVKNIDSSAFEDCHSLTSVILSRDLTCIESSAFKGCSDLSSITMYNRVTSIGLSAFENCSNLQSINLSGDLTSIGDSAFKGCTNLNSIVVPDSVTSIGYGVFSGCTNLTTITLPFVGGLEEDDNTNYFGYIFGAQTYYENSNYVPSVLKNIILTGSTKIGISAFRSCVNLEHITLPNTITTIETNAFFECSNLESITIPNSVTSIGDSAFLRCESLSSIEIPNSVTNMNSSVFYKCTNLQSVILSSNLINIGYAAFLGCESLNNVVVPNSVTSIEGYAFYGCSNLENIIIPNSVTSIEIFAFGKCTNLKNITLPFIGGKEVDGYRSHFGYIFGASISDENGIYVPSSLKEVILTGGVKIGISAFQNCANLKHITLPNTITDIKANAFYGCSNLEDIIIPDSITNIGSVAFKECTSLVSITIPDSVTNIGDGAFENCFNLENVIIQREISKITNLGENAFDSCKSTLQIVVPMDRVAEYKNKAYWSKYASKIVSNFSEFPELDLNCVSNFTNVTMLLSGYNKIYKLNVECAKTYKITSTSSYGIKMRLYNSSMVLMESSIDIIDQYLGKGTYYIDLEFLSNTSSGTINTTYELKWANDGENLRYNKDNNALKHLHKIDSNLYKNEMFYSNTRGAGFYKFILTATRFDGKSVYYPKGAITIYSDKERTTIIDKFCLSEYLNLAQTSQDQNNMIVYLPLNGNYYIDVSMTTDELESLYLKITYVDSQELDLFNLSEMDNEQVSIISETIKGDYIKSLNVEQAGKFTISALYDGNSSNDILFVVAKLIYNSSMNTYSLQTKFTTIMNDSNDTYTSTFSLDKGTYFVGYFNKEDTKAFNVSFNRLVTQYGSSVLIPDPNSSSVGSQVGVYEKDLKVTEKSYRGTTIVTGFTRVIYLDSHFVNNTSRKDYYWYSNNTNVASVSEYGTVFGKSKGDVKIMAVNKNNPSIVFVKSFTVIDDPNTSSETIIVPIYVTHNINKGDYQIGLTVQNCPYPSVQYYTWSIDYKDDTITSVKIDAWGKVKIEGTGEIIIKGTDYLYNDKYIVEIHLTVIDE